MQCSISLDVSSLVIYTILFYLCVGLDCRASSWSLHTYYVQYIHASLSVFVGGCPVGCSLALGSGPVVVMSAVFNITD